MLTGLLDRATRTEPGLTRPTVTLTFGGPGSDAGGIGGALGAAAAAVGLGGATGPGLEAGLVRLRLRRGVAPAVDVAEMLLAPVPGGPDLPAPGDAGEIALTAGDAAASFACTIDLREARSDGLVRLTATNGGRTLARARLEKSFESQTPGAIIDALADEAGVTGRAGSGTGDRLPRYLADEGRSLLGHLARLAATAGRLAAFDDAGALILIDDAAQGGEAVARLAAGETLVDWRIGAREAPGGSVTVDGAGAADKGGNAWAWLRKEPGPFRAEAGSGPPARRLPASWARSEAAVGDLAAARARAVARAAAQGRFLAVAVPQAVPGAVIEIAGTGTQDGLWLVLSVDLTFDLAGGMLSEIRAAPAGAAGDGPGLPGGLP